MTATLMTSRWYFAGQLLAVSLLPSIVVTALVQIQSDWILNTPLVLLGLLALILGQLGGLLSALAAFFVVVAVIVAVYEQYVLTTRRQAAVKGMLTFGVLLAMVMLGAKLVVVEILTGLSSI